MQMVPEIAGGLNGTATALTRTVPIALTRNAVHAPNAIQRFFSSNTRLRRTMFTGKGITTSGLPNSKLEVVDRMKVHKRLFIMNQPTKASEKSRIFQPRIAPGLENAIAKIVTNAMLNRVAGM